MSPQIIQEQRKKDEKMECQGANAKRTHTRKENISGGKEGGAKAFSRSDHAPKGKPTLVSSLFSARAPRRRRTFLNGFLISSSAGFFAASMLPLASSSSSASSACRGDDGAYTYCFTGGPLGARHHPPGEHVNLNSTRVTRLLEQVGQVGVDRAWEREEMAHTFFTGCPVQTRHHSLSRHVKKEHMSLARLERGRRRCELVLCRAVGRARAAGGGGAH